MSAKKISSLQHVRSDKFAPDLGTELPCVNIIHGFHGKTIQTQKNICCDTLLITLKGNFCNDITLYFLYLKLLSTLKVIHAMNRLDNISIKVIYLLNSQKEDINRLSDVGMHLPPTKSTVFSYRWSKTCWFEVGVL